MVGTDRLARTVTPQQHQHDATTDEWAVEPAIAFRLRNGLGGRFTLGSDGKDNGLSAAQKRRFGRLRTWDERLSSRECRLQEALRDTAMVVANTGLPDAVGRDAARLVKQAADAGVPQPRLPWEALAGGAVLLAVRRAGLQRDPETLTQPVKASHERCCAAARKTRLTADLQNVPPVRPRAIERVLGGLDAALSARRVLRLETLTRHFMALADAEPIGQAVPRTTIVAAAVYRADHLLPGKRLSRALVADAASHLVPVTKHPVGNFGQQLRDAYRARHGRLDPRPVLGQQVEPR